MIFLQENIVFRSRMKTGELITLEVVALIS